MGERLPPGVGLVLGGLLLAAASILAWEGVEHAFYRDASVELVRNLHRARGFFTGLLLMGYAAIWVLRQRRRAERALQDEVARRTEELRSSQAFSELLLNSMPDRLTVLDRDLRILKANRAARERHGEDIVGRLCYQVYEGRETPCEDCPAYRVFESGAPVGIERADAGRGPGEVLAVDAFPVGVGGEAVLERARVITEQKRLQAQLVRQEKMAAFGSLAAAVAHDIANPLASISSEIQLLEMEGGEPTRSALAGLRQHVDRIARTLREMVDFTRRRGDRVSDTSLNTVVTETLRLLHHDPRMRAVTMDLLLDPDVPAVRAVEDHVAQVLFNLFLNALDAMPAGGRLRVSTTTEDGTVRLEVADTGTGMTPDVLERAFEPFFTTKAPGKGTGLGLFITRELVREMGGELSVVSGPGAGSRFVILLPVAEAVHA